MDPHDATHCRVGVEDFRRQHRTDLVTLVFTDVVESTQLKQDLGDRTGAAVIQQHRALVRELLGRFPESAEIETAGDSFLLVFSKPSAAVTFGLMLLRRQQQLSQETGHRVQLRLGIHLGEVVVEEHQAGQKARDLYGLQIDTCARILSLAKANQILRSRGVFDSGRQVLKGEDIEGLGPLDWLNHGPYLLKGIEESVDICEVREAGRDAAAGPPTTSETNSATRQLQVRRAIAMAVDKAALVKLSGGPRVARVLRQAVPSSVSGHRKGADQYVTPGDRGDPAEARALLTAAGSPNGISLRLAYINTRDRLLAQSLQASLARAGITVELAPMTEGDFYGRLLAYSENGKRGEWDLALDGAQPPWFGENNGCSVIGPLFDGRRFGQNSWNCGGYSNAEVNLLIDRATAAARLTIGAPAWSEAARRAMEQVAIIPLIEIKSPYSHSWRLRNRTWAVLAPTCDITSVWLADAASEQGRLR